jgi:hypothetical protein
MANNTTLNAGSGGDSIADVDLANFGSFGYPTTTGKLPVCALYVSQAIGTIPTAVTTANALPVAQQGGLPAGANTIGNVGLVAGAATIGTVLLGAGTAAVGTVTTNADCAVGAGTAPTKAILGAGVYNATAPLATSAQTVGLQTDPAGNLRVTGVGGMNTYSASASFVPVASATDIAILPGSASKTIKVLRVKLQLSSTSTTAQNIVAQLIKRGAANTGGTSSAMTVVPHNSGNTTATAAPLTYTANPTINNTVGAVDTGIVSTQQAPTAGTAGYPQNEWVVDYTAPGMQPIVLSGVAQGLAVNLGGVTVSATATAKVTFTYTEE